MDYKNTLNLPKTGFAMKADLVAREPQRLAQWQASGLYRAIQARRAGAAKFVLHDGPPFANGDVHIGNALNKILKDIIIRYKTLRGFSAPYVPGWDCHGLPIESKISKEMRQAGDARADAAALRSACDAYACKYIDIQRTQFKRLGILGDWENPYLTLNKEYEAGELRLFADVVEQGFVYRGKKPVYWSIPFRTALAEAEVEYQDHVSQSIYVKFPVVGQPGLNIVIWTTTPWTLPANLAVAYNSTFSYSMIRGGREAYIVSTMLLPAIAEKCGWEGYEIIRSLEAADLAHLEFHHPFCNRTGRLFAGDDFVTSDTGTGFVHIAPGHGMDDYKLGLRHGLPIYSPVDDNGRLVHTTDLPVDQQMPAGLVGKSTLERHGQSEANNAVLDELRAREALLHREDYHHSYPHCWRSKTPVIFRATDQWFIKIDHEIGGVPFRQRALEAIRRVDWIPDWGRSRIEGAVASRPDWCVSRQRAWGVPIPAFYTAQDEAILDPRVVRNTARLFEEHGSNVWFEKSAEELWPLVKPADWPGPAPVKKSSDTLDVWIDSGSSSRSVLMSHPELAHDQAPADSVERWQADLYLEGSDQHRGWFQSSLLLSLAGNGAPPYRQVLTHGFMVDADREKISKSKQSGYEKPQTADAYVEKWGADVLRLWVASQDFRDDVIVSEQRIGKVAESYRLLRNTLRYQLSNLYDFDPARHAVPEDRLTGLDRWILSEFSRLEASVVTAFDACEFHTVYQRVSQFAAVELSAVYHDVVKDRLYTDRADSARRRSTQTALHRLVHGLCRMLSPVLVFTADEAWECVPGKTEGSVHLQDWKPEPLSLAPAEQQVWAVLFELRALALPELEAMRRDKHIGKSLEARLALRGPEAKLGPILEHQDTLRELLNVSQIEVSLAGDAESPVTVAGSKASGQKCERCWHWETDVGSNPAHPPLCGRCVAAVS